MSRKVYLQQFCMDTFTPSQHRLEHMLLTEHEVHPDQTEHTLISWPSAYDLCMMLHISQRDAPASVVFKQEAAVLEGR